MDNITRTDSCNLQNKLQNYFMPTAKKTECCGCGLCVDVCPVGAIKMLEDEEGFAYPKIDDQICIECQACVKNCIYNNAYDAHQSLKLAYAMENISDDERLSSSSGGIFTALATEFINIGGSVVSPSFGKDFRLSHKFFNTAEQLKDFKGSKYTQSEMNLYCDINKKLQVGDKILFTGTPCQVSALKSYLKIDYENLYTQDLICHGCSSSKVFKKYIQYLEKIYNSSVVNFDFRNKKNGWANFCIHVVFENGKTFTQVNNQNTYFKLFLYNYTLRPACYKCIFRKQNRASDITLADFWGLKDHDNKGSSLVILNTEKGEKLYQMINNQVRSYNVDFKESLTKNTAYNMDMPEPQRRAELMAENFSDFAHIEKRYLNRSFSQKVLQKTKKNINQ